MTEVVRVRALTKRYGDTAAVDDVTFALPAGTVPGSSDPTARARPPRCGSCSGSAAPTSGEAQVFGRPYAELDRPARRVGAVLEAGDFHPARTGRDHLRVLAATAGLPRRRVDEVLALVELAGDAAARRHLLAGHAPAAGARGALLGAPDLLILDEPANGLDPDGVHWLRGFLRKFADEGRTVLLSSHVLAEVAQTVDAS